MNIKSKLRQDLLFLDATDRVPVRTVVVAHTCVDNGKVEAVGVVAVRPGRPVEAVVASIVGSAVAVVTDAGSREKHLRDSCCIWIRTAEPKAVLAVF